DLGQQEMILAYLSQLPIEMFEESATGWHLYLPASAFDESFEAELKSICSRFDLTFSQEYLEDKNWNAEWESNFEPVLVGSFCAIRATFHQPIYDTLYEIIVDPKMAFGTGHHETTFMMVQAMEQLPLQGRKVLDYGCGTGVLAILAHKLGAAPITAIDIDPLSVESTEENVQLNETPGLTILEGDLEVVEAADFDCILANINRNVILHALPQLATLCKAGGSLLTSGFLEGDEDLVKEAAAQQNFRPVRTFDRGEWRCIQFEKV
ncbi:MAG: 50S ribosomal protein L11 methyltransferase, partial [Phaeodactylibacter sp.]|nr:50S ribosomal protein L11 methyltransferase [Phaeodactylibacter sp.]